MSAHFTRIRLTKSQLAKLDASQPPGCCAILIGCPVRKGVTPAEHGQVNLVAAWVPQEDAERGLEASGILGISDKGKAALKRKLPKPKT